MVIAAVSLVVIVGVLNARDHEHTDERDGGGDGRERRDDGDQLQHQQAQEVEVGQPLELLEQVVRDEVQQRVLGGLDVVFGIIKLRVELWVVWFDAPLSL